MYTVNKQLGETPLACLERIRYENMISSDVPMTYAGRLDPMAEGLMIILEGDECKDKEKYTRLDKTYEFGILVGFETDTYDLLGLVTEKENGSVIPDLIRNLEGLQDVLNSFVGKQAQSYPAYSSKTVDGKQLHTYAREGTAVESPKHEIEIYNLRCTSTVILKKDELEKQIQERIGKIVGDFRQTEILQKWSEVLSQTPQTEFHILSCTIDCGPGTYVRQLVHDIGEKLGVPMVTFSIKRTKVGHYYESLTK
jgi:tRNA pseudouridine55 synthase